MTSLTRRRELAQIIKSRRHILLGIIQRRWKINPTSSTNAYNNADILSCSLQNFQAHIRPTTTDRARICNIGHIHHPNSHGDATTFTTDGFDTYPFMTFTRTVPVGSFLWAGEILAIFGSVAFTTPLGHGGSYHISDGNAVGSFVMNVVPINNIMLSLCSQTSNDCTIKFTSLENCGMSR